MIFDFKCTKCERIELDAYMPFEHEESDHPVCCDGYMQKHFTTVPVIHWKDYQLPDGGFKAAHDGTVITSRKQNLEYMKRHGLQDANEVYTPPTKHEQMREHEKTLETIAAITPDEKQMHQLKSDGIVDESGAIITD
jgi:hypothetical protein